MSVLDQDIHLYDILSAKLIALKFIKKTMCIIAWRGIYKCQINPQSIT